MFGEQIAFCLTKKEIDYLLNKKYRIQGDMMIKGRIRAGTILFYLMKQYYPSGIDLYDDKSIDFLREKAMENFDGFELSENNRALRARIQDCCIPIGRGIWKVECDECLISQSLKDDINNYIESYKIPIVPVTAIFNKFSAELCSVGIDNRYFLQGQLKKVVLPCYTLTRDYVLKSENANLYSLVEQYVKNTEGGIITKNDIQREFPGITDVTIQMIAQATGVLNMNGYYVHIDNLGLTESDIALLKTQIDDVLNDGAIHHVKSIFNKAKKLTTGLLLRIGINHYLQFYYLIHELFSDEYEFNRPFVEKKLSQKFDLFWEKALKKLSHGNERFFSIRTENYRYYFNKISSRIDSEPCIVCKRALIENGKEKGFKDRKVYSKKEFKEIYVKYEQYKKELNSVFLSGKEFVPDAYAGNFTCDKATKELYLLQRKYSIIFLRCIGLDVIKEQRCLYLNLDEIRDYICDAKRRYCNRYFEFQKYGLKKIQPLLDSPIEVILLDSKYERFITFCKEKCINDLTSLLFVPYYAVTLVNRFGASLIGSVLFDIKRYVKVQILFEKYVSMEDMEG